MAKSGEIKLLNVGCGIRFHREWTNVDFVCTGQGVIAHNLLEGIPFAEGSFVGVYHSHVLEHFSKSHAPKLIQECHRVLCPGGILRIAVPDLEGLVRLYLQKLEAAAAGDAQAAHDYEWMMLELYDQFVRTQSGGEMAKYLFQETLPNQEFVYGRIGEQAPIIRDAYFAQKALERESQGAGDPAAKPAGDTRSLLTKFKDKVRARLKKQLFASEARFYEAHRQHLEIAKFRAMGEIHQWNYDRYSLRKLLEGCGFHSFRVVTATESSIPGWERYELDSKDGTVIRPDSLFAEAVK